MDKEQCANQIILLGAGLIIGLKYAVCKEGVKLSPEQMKVIKEMRDNLNDIIVEDMYWWNIECLNQENVSDACNGSMKTGRKARKDFVA